MFPPIKHTAPVRGLAVGFFRVNDLTRSSAAETYTYKIKLMVNHTIDKRISIMRSSNPKPPLG